MNPHITHFPRARTEAERPVSVVLDAISNQRRRRALALLSEDTGTMTVDELVEALAAEDDELDCPETLRLELHHCHLPKLADSGLVRYDTQSHRVSVRPRLAELDSLLDDVRPSDGVA